MRTVGEWMTRDPVAAVDSAPLGTAAVLMMRHHFRHLPVLDEVEGRLVGLVDDAAVFARGDWVGERFRLHDARDVGLTVADTMAEALTAEPTASLSDTLSLLLARGQDAVVVIENHRRPVGILTAHDVVRAAMRLLPETLTTEQLSSPVLSVARTQNVGAAFDTMQAHRVRHLVVVEGDRAVGVVGWRDLAVIDAPWRRSRKLADLDLGPLETVAQGTSLPAVADRMVAQKIGALPVIDRGGQLVGVVTRTELMAQIVARLG